MATVLRTDIIPKDLLETQQRVIVTNQFGAILSAAAPLPDRSRTPAPAKNLDEFYGLVQGAIQDYERRQNVIDDGKVHFTSEDIDLPKDKNLSITFSLVKRMPGSFSQGPPFQGDTHNQKPMLREEIEDPENPGYKRAILGYWHDNEVCFTIFARTNKAADAKALWFENIMQEYSWYFTSQGVARVIFMRREQDYTLELNGTKMYGRPLFYFVRTETLRTVSEKTIEQILINTSLSNGITT